MKEIKLGKYDEYPYDECQRCGDKDLIHYKTDGGFYICDLCAKKMIFDREHLVD